MSFGLAHLENYTEINHGSIIQVLLLQGVGSVTLSYTAMSYGLKYSIFSHLFFNFSLLGISKVLQIYKFWQYKNLFYL